MDKEHLVRIGIFIKITSYRFSWRGQTYVNVVVHQKGVARFQKIIFGGHVKTDELSASNILFHCNLWANVQRFTNFLDLSGSMNMVRKRGHTIKSDSTEKLLVIEPAIGLFELGMPLLRNFPEFMINRHFSLFRVRSSEFRVKRIHNSTLFTHNYD